MNFLSWSKHKRRLGAADVLASYFDDESKLLNDLVTPDYFNFLSVTHLTAHINKLANDLEGQPLLVLYHAVLIVLIRREYKTEIIFGEFEQLWQEYGDELKSKLSLRWLVSAADTFIDYHPDINIKLLMLNVSILINTVKIYETENSACIKEFNEQSLLTKKKLFDGLETFVVNSDDSLSNMKSRLLNLIKDVNYGFLLEEIFERLQTHDTAYARLKAKHLQKRTQW